MQHVFYLLLMRLRKPIITIITVFAISTLGFVLIPGEDAQGNPWRMDFFHAFYFVSFMGSTIGFGEIPYPFTAAQRAWTIFSIYATVIAWLYSIGTILSLLQDQNYLRHLKLVRFTRRVNALKEPFYLVCGFGVTGSYLAHKLQNINIDTVVIDVDQLQIDKLETDSIPLYAPGICADAADPNILNISGLKNSYCIGVLALTNDDRANLKIAINSKLVNPERLVISNTQSQEMTANLDSFGTDHIIDPFDTYASQMAMILTTPYQRLIYELLADPYHKINKAPHEMKLGRWVICGFGRFGQALYEQFKTHRIETTFIEITPDKKHAPPGTVWGIGTEAKTLKEANIESAVGIIAGTGDDADNLSIIITAREINPKLVTMVRQNEGSNQPIFAAANVDLIMEPGRIIANEIFLHIRAPLLTQFFAHATRCSNDWARDLFVRIVNILDKEELHAWTLTLDQQNCPSICDALNRAKKIPIQLLFADPRNREKPLAALPLLVKRNDDYHLLPKADFELHEDDQILFCGQYNTQTLVNWTAHNHNILRYLATGNESPDGYLWRWISSRNARSSG